jgi:2-phosphosulfolactate phosphatase
MSSLHVALTPRDPAPAAVQIVVDCIRATSTIAQALAAGYGEVVCAGEIDEARRIAAAIGPGAVLGGERRGVRIVGFDLGNSPAEYLEPRGTTVVLTTTNGTRAILQAATEASTVLVGSLTCLAAVVDAAVEIAGADGDVSIRCAGVRGEAALDDLYTAGRIVELLAALLPSTVVTDTARTALGLVRAYADPLAALADSQSARDLDGTGHEADVARCAAVATLAVAPRVVEVAPGRAVVRA